MTKEELKQEAEEYVYKALGFDKDYIKQELNRKYNPIEPWEKSEPIDPIINETMEAYLAGAEPREKQIEIDAKQIRALQKQNGELADEVKELEAQIEKMKSDLNKIIKTVQNDNISSYGDRLVKIYDISCEVLQELEK